MLRGQDCRLVVASCPSCRLPGGRGGHPPLPPAASCSQRPQPFCSDLQALPRVKAGALPGADTVLPASPPQPHWLPVPAQQGQPALCLQLVRLVHPPEQPPAPVPSAGSAPRPPGSKLAPLSKIAQGPHSPQVPFWLIASCLGGSAPSTYPCVQPAPLSGTSVCLPSAGCWAPLPGRSCGTWHR